MSRKYRRYARKHMHRRDNTYKKRRIPRVIGQIFFWLLIFVVGSLIVSFILSPSASNLFSNTVSKTKGFIEKAKVDDFDYTKTIRIQPGLYCTDINLLARESGQSSKQAMKRGCIYLCDYASDSYDGSVNSTNGTYAQSTCENDMLTCYCYK